MSALPWGKGFAESFTPHVWQPDLAAPCLRRAGKMLSRFLGKSFTPHAWRPDLTCRVRAARLAAGPDNFFFIILHFLLTSASARTLLSLLPFTNASFLHPCQLLDNHLHFKCRLKLTIFFFQTNVTGSLARVYFEANPSLCRFRRFSRSFVYPV